MENNFIETLTEDEKKLFLRVLFTMIKSDGKVEESERQMAHELIALYNVKNYGEVLRQTPPVSELLQEIKTTLTERKKAILLLRELLIIAHIDDDFDEKEMQFVEQVAGSLQIEESVVLELNQLVLDYKLLLLRSQKIMEG